MTRPFVNIMSLTGKMKRQEGLRLLALWLHFWLFVVGLSTLFAELLWKALLLQNPGNASVTRQNFSPNSRLFFARIHLHIFFLFSFWHRISFIKFEEGEAQPRGSLKGLKVDTTAHHSPFWAVMPFGTCRTVKFLHIRGLFNKKKVHKLLW